jgi:hypothetical protein
MYSKWGFAEPQELVDWFIYGFLGSSVVSWGKKMG